jgi:hypothetical protein
VQSDRGRRFRGGPAAARVLRGLRNAARATCSGPPARRAARYAARHGTGTRSDRVGIVLRGLIGTVGSVVAAQTRLPEEECTTPAPPPVEAQSVRFQCNRARWPIGWIGRKRPLRGLGGVGRRTGRQRAGPDHSERTTPRPGSWVAPGIWPKLKLTRSVNLLLPHSRRSPSASVAWSEPALCHRTAFPATVAKSGTCNGPHWRRSRSRPLTVSPTTQKTKIAVFEPGRRLGS